MNTVLFLCTGNYYRSRYAEILFNWHARQRGLPWQADSRGLALDRFNPGPMSSHTMSALRKLGIALEEYLRLPLQAAETDFARAHHIVAVKEAEHRPLITRNFVKWLDRVEFWQVHDLDCSGPEDTIAHLDREVAALLQRLAKHLDPCVPPMRAEP